MRASDSRFGLLIVPVRLAAAIVLGVCICGCVLPCTARTALASEIEQPAGDEPETTDISAATVSLDEQTYTGFELTPKPTVELEGETLTAGTDYTVAYDNNVDPGEATVTVTGAGAYTGIVVATFTINPHPAGWDTVDGTDYYYTAEGTLCRNAFAPRDGRYHYMGADGKNVTNQWVKSGGKIFYVGEEGYALTNSWVETDGAYYYVNASGNPVVNNWAKIGGRYYYFNGYGNPVVNAWRKISGRYYYFNAYGNPVTSSWRKIGGYYYYFNASGNPVANNWLKYDGKWYYFNGYGNPVVNAWRKISGSYYHFNGYGVMQTGLVTIDGEAYIFNNDGTLRYISNDSRVDRIVCRIIRDYTGFNVRAAYNFVANSFTYVVSSTASNFNNWEEYYALNLWNTGRGNCFGYSSLFHFLLNAMGYSSKTIAGTCNYRGTNNYYDHCWVEVYMNGQTYVCDPVLENAYTLSGIYSYFITYAQNRAATTWIVYVV